MQGYVFTELAKLTHADVVVCDKMADWLADKVKKNEANVKWKALQVVKQVSKGGRGEFRRSMQRHAEHIKACLQFRGPPDPLKGDEPYRRVRDTAKEALEAVYDNSSVGHAGAGHGAAGGAVGAGRITGFSSEEAGIPAAYPSTYGGAGAAGGSYGGSAPPPAFASSGGSSSFKSTGYHTSVSSSGMVS